jgi:pimeloyl-ACP methyl ester carboxylesterase
MAVQENAMERNPLAAHQTDETHREMGPTALPARDEGTGIPLLLVHGLLGTGESFDLMAALLGQRYRLVTPDLRGHGQSRHLPGPYEAEALAADLVPTLDTHGIEKVHVLGYSHGGATAQVFAAA